MTHRWREDEEDDQRAEKTKEQGVDFESRDGQGRSTTTQILRDFRRQEEQLERRSEQKANAGETKAQEGEVDSQAPRDDAQRL